MKIIVTGGAGFLGSNLCGYLLSLGHQVTAIDNLITGSYDNIAEFISHPEFKFLEYDVINPLPDDLKADWIFHLASPASPNIKSLKSYHNLCFETMQVNSQGTWNIAEFCLAQGARLLFSSTSEVYGDPLIHPQTEDYRGNVSTTGPRSVYDEAKRFGETIVSSFVRKKQLDARIVRIFNTYGPKMALDDGRVVMEFILAALNQKPFPIFGDGLQTRSFCYVDDLVRGLVSVIEKDGLWGEVFNLGNSDEFTILELAQKIKHLTNSISDLSFPNPLPVDDPLKRRPDTTKAARILGWKPNITLDSGLPRLIEYVISQQAKK